MIFTDEIKPASAEVIDVDADGDGGVVAWTENDGTVMKVSTQIKGIKVQAAVNSSNMFYDKSKIRKIDFKMLNTSNVTNMSEIFRGCNRLTSLDLTPLDTSKVTSMYGMFCDCYAKSLDLTPLDTSNVKNMNRMFYFCSRLTTITTGPKFKFVGTDYYLFGTWQNTAGETFTNGTFPSNVADTYTKI